MSKRLVSVDIGSVDVKAHSSTATVTFPSIVAPEQGGIRFEGLGSDYFTIELNGERLALGRTAYSLGHIQISDMGRARVQGDTYRRLAAGAFASVLGRSTPISLIASLPIRFYMGKTEDLKESLAGDYRIEYEGRSLRFKLDYDDVHIIPEGFGSLCSLILNPMGQVINGELADMRVGIVDIGGRTTDMLMFDSLELQPALSTGMNKSGLSIIWQVLDNQIEEYYGRSLTLIELDEALHTGYFRNGPDRIDIRSEITVAAETLASSIIASINSLWDDGNAVEQIVLTGGGAPFIAPFMSYRHVLNIDDEVPISPHLTNAIGAFYFGLLQGFAE